MTQEIAVKWAGKLLSMPLLLGGPIARADPGHKSTPTRKPPSLSLASPSPAPLRSPRASWRLVAYPISAAPKEAPPLVGGVKESATTACSAVVCGPASAAARSGQAGHKAPRCRPRDSCLVRSQHLQGLGESYDSRTTC